MKIPVDMIPGTIHKTNNYGTLKIVSYKSALEVEVKFIETGFVKTSDACNVRAGRVKDPFFPCVYGVGYLGEGNHKPTKNRVGVDSYKTWR